MELLDATRIRALVGSMATGWGEKVAARRESLGISQQALADAIGTNLITVKRIESGTQVPRDRVRFAIAFALATDVADLFPYPDRKRIASAKAEDAA